MLPRHLAWSVLPCSRLSFGAFVAVLAPMFAMAMLAGQAQARPNGDWISLKIGAFEVQAEVAATADKRSRGLMFRESLPDNHGMLFVFEGPSKICMWMKNTPLPLTVAFIDAAGTILNLEDMRPHTEQPHCAAAEATYALEMERGWFSDRGLAAGRQVRGLPPAAAAIRPRSLPRNPN